MKTRKELKEEYKQKKFRMGIFCITNTVNGKIFIGSSLDLVAIWHAQRFQLNAGMHPNEKLQQDWNQFGSENFMYEIIEEIIQSDETTIDYNKEVKVLEALAMDELQPYEEKGYNKKR